MADADFHALIQAVNRLVVEDTGAESSASVYQLARRLNGAHQRSLQRLAGTLDLPARLAPAPRTADERPAIRAALTEAVANSAALLEPSEPLVETDHVFGRARLGTAMSRAYAAFATPRLLPGLIPGGRPDDLGLFPTPVVEGDVAAARAVAVAISARNGRPEQLIMTELVAAGRGAVAPAAADMLLRSRPGYAALPAPERSAVQQLISDQLESVFEGTERQRLEADRDPSAVLQDRQAAVAVGSDAVTAASMRASEEIGHLHEFFDERGWPAPVRRPESLYELCEQVRGAVGEVAGVPESRWDGRVGEAGDETALQLPQDQAEALAKLLRGGPGLDAEDAAQARAGLRTAAVAFAGWAVPSEYGRADEDALRSVAPRFAATERAVSTAFAEDNFRAIVDRALPGELADQVRRAAAPPPDRAHAPAARAFATAVDGALGRRPGETLREMAGEGRARMALVAAEALVADARMRGPEQPYAVEMITDEIDRGFANPPVDDPHRHGQQMAKLALTMAKLYADNPTTARRAAEAQQFAPGHDRATPTLRTVSAPSHTPEASQPGSGVPSEPRER